MTPKNFYYFLLVFKDIEHCKAIKIENITSQKLPIKIYNYTVSSLILVTPTVSSPCKSLPEQSQCKSIAKYYGLKYSRFYLIDCAGKTGSSGLIMFRVLPNQ